MKNIYAGPIDISLFHLAARHWGDPCLWWRLLEVNQLTDYDLSLFEQNVPLKIPSEANVNRTGLPNEVSAV